MIVLPPVQQHTPVSGLLDITQPAFKVNPLPFYARLRDQQPVYRARMGSQPTWLITRYDDVFTALKDERLVKRIRNVQTTERVAAPWVPKLLRPLGTNMLDQDAPVHPRLRGLVQKAFTPRRIEELQGKVQQVADQLLDAAERKGSFDLITDFALPLPLTVIIELLGVPDEQRAIIHHWSSSILHPHTRLNMLLRIMLPTMTFMRELRALFEQRRRAPKDDLLTALVHAEEAGDRLSQNELLGMVALLLIAGHETTVNLISCGILALLQHPAQLERLRADPALIKPAIEELLRFTSPVETATERYAREPMTIAGQPIKPGDMVLAVLASANRDEHHFTQPDTLDLGRTPNRHLAFGHGPHFCLGASLARMEGQIAIATLLRRMPNLRLAVSPDQLRWRGTPIVRGLAALPVRA